MNSRRKFIKSAVGASMGVWVGGHLSGNELLLSGLPLADNLAVSPLTADHEVSPFTMPDMQQNQSPRIRYSVIGLNHPHITNSLIPTVMSGGSDLVAFYAKEDDLADDFTRRYPQAKRVQTEAEILEDSSIQLVLSAGIPSERAPLGIRVMEHGKDFYVAKPGITSLSQLAKVRKVQQKTGRIYSINYGRLGSKTLMKASELIKAGAIGKVVQTIGKSPHRLRLQPRPDWFYDKKYFGGILCDLATHEIDTFLFLTGSTSGKIIAAQTGNFGNRQYSDFEDFGDAMIQGDKGAGYLRVDWLMPDGVNISGDSRMTILGTDGYIEIRSAIDLAGRNGGNHLFLVDHKGVQYINCNDVEVSHGKLLVDDVVNRTETLMTQAHCFLATELTLLAQKKAVHLSI